MAVLQRRINHLGERGSPLLSPQGSIASMKTLESQFSDVCPSIISGAFLARLGVLIPSYDPTLLSSVVLWVSPLVILLQRHHSRVIFSAVLPSLIVYLNISYHFVIPKFAAPAIQIERDSLASSLFLFFQSNRWLLENSGRKKNQESTRLLVKVSRSRPSIPRGDRANQSTPAHPRRQLN